MSEKIQFGQYTLEERLSVGTLAEIWRAKTQTAGGDEGAVVVKRVRDELAKDPAFRQMFVDEAKVAAVLDHPNIAKVLEWNQFEDALYFAMEYIQGTNLASLMQFCLEQGRRIPAEHALFIGAELLSGLAYAHGLSDSSGKPLGIVHRGVMPHSVLLSASGEVKLVDFGLARAASELQGTRPGLFKGQDAYLAPEVQRNKDTDARADLYSVGVILYELLTGVKLRGGLDAGVEREIRARPPSQIRPESDPEVSALVLRACATDREERPASAELFRAELARTLGPGPESREALVEFLLEVLSGASPTPDKPGKKKRRSFAFGEATSHWFEAGEKLVRAKPPASAREMQFTPYSTKWFAEEANLAQDGPRSSEMELPPRKRAGLFGPASTSTAIKASGLGWRRSLRNLLLAGLAIAVMTRLAIWFVDKLGSEPGSRATSAKLTAPSAHSSLEASFAGPLEIRTTPAGALVFVDGDVVRPNGNPPQVLNLRPGRRRIKLIVPGFVPWEGDIQLQKGASAKIVQQLVERRGELIIRARPDAQVTFNGKRLGLTPQTLRDISAVQEHKIELSAEGGPTVRLSVGPADWPEDPAQPLVLDRDLTLKKSPKKPR